MVIVSLVISTYNWPQALEACIKSVFSQTQLPNEIVIADDGSAHETLALIDALRKESPVPIVHVWHEDNGFRLSEIRNKAFAQSKGDYIIQIDGDIVLEKHFIADHIEAIEDGCFVCGSRVHLDKETSKKILSGTIKQPSVFNIPFAYFFNSLRIYLLRLFLATRYGQKKIDHLRGCNMAFWKRDIIKVNGYNENLTFWGHEDGELAYRLYFAGVKKKFIKFGAVCYHLYHKSSSRENEQTHLDAIKNVIENRISRCQNGIDKYL